MTTDSPTTTPVPGSAREPDLKVLWTRLALFVAVVGTLGSLHLSIQMQLQACPLCYYQRAFMMSAAAVLLFAMFLPGVPTSAVAILALSPALAGAAIAAHHSALVWKGFLECPKGITGALTAPEESLLVFSILVVALLGDLVHRNRYIAQGIGALLLGYLLCNLCMRSTVPLPEPTVPYEDTGDLKTCRRPFKDREKL